MSKRAQCAVWFLPFWVIGFRNGGPALRTMLMKMYWKHENKNKAVFSELTMLLFSRSSCGGKNLHRLLDLCWWYIATVTHHGCNWTVSKTANCDSTTSKICPSKGVNTLRETRSAVGRFRDIVGEGSAQPTRRELAHILGFSKDRPLTEDRNGHNEQKVDKKKLKPR